MLVLANTTDTIEVVLGGSVTTNQLRCVSAWRDVTTTAYTPGRTVTNTNNTTAVAAVAAPGASTQRVVDLISVYNADTVSQTVTVKYDDNGTEYVLWSGTLTSGETLTYCDGAGWSRVGGTLGYTLAVQALTTTPTDAQTVYFGSLPKAPVTAAATSKVYIPKTGTLKRAEIYCFSGTAGTAESWSLYVRHNNATDYLIATLAVSASERIFNNSSLAIAVSAGDYFEIKGVQPTWATNPATTIYGGYVYIE
jgi:hypothetical protein